MADTTRAACHRCGSADAVNVSSGYPDHVWRWWCRSCLAANRRAYQEDPNAE